eukprot:CAMPEP_0119118526 /NCGR_PEP_ID=MMETSP1310-20130426/377_1 /TAXON_ID=464262 /ORGANISM="Genus nov. species nov., Strain RCC2339" /LENGTH=57 /DNA_ID=CAMNT_0007107903 /DNA_START=160 /DNA_END=330 /DNA_ORIENTATION=-
MGYSRTARAILERVVFVSQRQGRLHTLGEDAYIRSLTHFDLVCKAGVKDTSEIGDEG